MSVLDAVLQAKSEALELLDVLGDESSARARASATTTIGAMAEVINIQASLLDRVELALGEMCQHVQALKDWDQQGPVSGGLLNEGLDAFEALQMHLRGLVAETSRRPMHTRPGAGREEPSDVLR